MLQILICRYLVQVADQAVSVTQFGCIMTSRLHRLEWRPLLKRQRRRGSRILEKRQEFMTRDWTVSSSRPRNIALVRMFSADRTNSRGVVKSAIH